MASAALTVLIAVHLEPCVTLVARPVSQPTLPLCRRQPSVVHSKSSQNHSHHHQSKLELYVQTKNPNVQPMDLLAVVILSGDFLAVNTRRMYAVMMVSIAVHLAQCVTA
jgi:hypothetical protein